MREQQTRVNPFGVCVLGTIGLPRRTAIAPKERFFVGWRVRNDSKAVWKGWKLRSVFGEDMRIERKDPELPSTEPGQVVEILLEMQAPVVLASAGYRVYRCSYRLCGPDAVFTGPPMDYEIRVVPAPPLPGNQSAAPKSFAAVVSGAAKASASVPSAGSNQLVPGAGQPAAAPRVSDGASNGAAAAAEAALDAEFDLVEVPSAAEQAAAAGLAQGKGASLAQSGLDADVVQVDSDDDMAGHGHGKNKPRAGAGDAGDGSTPYDASLIQLTNMGFTDRSLNLRLLRQGKSVAEVVDFVLNGSP